MNPIARQAAYFLRALVPGARIGCASTGKQEGTSEYVDDAVITSTAKTAILRESALKALQINVETYKGVVQLSGFVDSQAMASKAANVAGSVSGVKSVKNDMRIR
jgi:osmotically-inducible protein OsmY